MKLSRKAINQFRKNPRLVNLIAIEMNKSAGSVVRWVTANEENGFLTTVKVVECIKRETGLTDGEILQDKETELLQS